MEIKENKQVVLFMNKEDCCGCGACQAICPVNAIDMELDEDGFYYPTICRQKCLGCRKCVSICAFQQISTQ